MACPSSWVWIANDLVCICIYNNINNCVYIIPLYITLLHSDSTISIHFACAASHMAKSARLRQNLRKAGVPSWSGHDSAAKDKQNDKTGWAAMHGTSSATYTTWDTWDWQVNGSEKNGLETSHVIRCRYITPMAKWLKTIQDRGSPESEGKERPLYSDVFRWLHGCWHPDIVWHRMCHQGAFFGDPSWTTCERVGFPLSKNLGKKVVVMKCL